MTQEISLSQFGRSFQEKVLQALLVDSKWAEQLIDVFDVTYLDQKYLAFLADRYFAYAKKYKVFPTLPILVTIIRDDLKQGTDIVLRDQIVAYLQRIKSNPDSGDLMYVKDKTLEFCRKQALRKALEQAVDHIQSEKYERIVEDLKKAVNVGTAPSMGHNFFEDFEARFTRLKRDCIPTGLEALDKQDILNGGLGRGELGCVVAATGVGKSHFLVSLGANAILSGYDVLHYTFELSETQVGVRYDSNLCEIDSNLIIDSRDDVLAKYDTLRKNQKLGKLYIKQYPTNVANIYNLRSHIERLSLNNFKPALLIVDYADIMRSTRQYDALRHELKLVYEELRALATEENYAVWTASQSNREGSSSDIVDLTNMSEAYGKAQVADVVVSISRKPHEKSSGSGRLYIAKNRAGRDGILYPIMINTAQSKFDVVSGEESFEEATANSKEELKMRINARWKELNKEMGQSLHKLKNSEQESEPKAADE